ncbi:MAG: glycosyltransferase family 39 protein [Candidatus Omnitrophota bacterium]|nr:MAG: glycosyltransferase family 39 protein [Candidatus Omnitrophota bacterium]
MEKHKKSKEQREKYEQRDKNREKQVDLLLILGLFIVILLPNLGLANLELISPDASGYLDMGRNLFSGRGAITSYNLYQFWPGKYHPFLPYMQPLYPIVAGLIWILFNLKAVIAFNIVLLSLNCILIYKIIRLKADYLTSALIALFMGFSQNLVFSAIYPWTEHLHLFFVLLAIYLYLRYEKSQFLVGVLLGVSCLTRVAGFYNIFAFGVALLILRGFSKDAFKGYLKIALGFLSIFLSYEIFCYAKYGILYPQYIGAARTYGFSWFHPGAFYKPTLPVLNAPPPSITTELAFKNIRNHLSSFIGVFGYAKFVFIVAPLYIIFDIWKRKTALFIVFFFQALVIMLGCVWGLRATPGIEALRYSLIPFITLGIIGFLSIKYIFESLSPKKRMKRYFFIIFLSLVSILFYFHIQKGYLPFRKEWAKRHPQRFGAYHEARDRMYAWIRENTDKDVLIASEFLADPVFFDRPFVSLPVGEALTAENFRDYLNIYKPDYVLTYHEQLVKFLKAFGFVEKKRSGSMVLLGKSSW